jgi:outer membrane protein W
VATVNQLPPTLILHRYFGSWGDTLRPSLGVGLNYTFFFDAEATPALESYTGGPTEIKLKPSFGLGVFAGMQYQLGRRIHLKLTLGYVDVKTTGTLTTRDTMLSSRSPVLQDYPPPVNLIASNPATQGILDSLIRDVARSRGGTLGTYERKIDSKLDPYVALLSVGYSF